MLIIDQGIFYGRSFIDYFMHIFCFLVGNITSYGSFLLPYQINMEVLGDRDQPGFEVVIFIEGFQFVKSPGKSLNGDILGFMLIFGTF